MRILKCGTVVILLTAALVRPAPARAQLLVGEVIKMTITKVIKALDLRVQRMQNQTLWLQNAQKALENELSKVRLNEIAGWSGQQQTLFQGYYDELWKIKAVISSYQRIQEVTVRQASLLSAYQRAWSGLRQDAHFSPAELGQMSRVYSGILSASAANLEQVMTVLTGGRTQMTDAQRMELINQAAGRMDGNYNDLRRFTAENTWLSLMRSKDDADIQTTRQLYGITQ